jgi:hypothetical protein
MDRLIVNSSNLITVGYDDAVGTLEVEFQSGKVYQYMNVPAQIYQGLMTASSKGEFFHDHILKQYDFVEA